MLFGYARVSTTDQNPAHQLDALTAAGVEPANCHLDHASGAKASRPQLDLLLHRLRDGDTLVVTRLDRLGRSVVHLITLSAELRQRGVGLRVLEDEVEAIVQALGLTYQLRTQFTGRSGRGAPCDLAIPEAGSGALIVCAVKGFDSTGSKLTDAVREIEAMADVRDPRQFVYAVVDGIGWLSRQADLRRIHTLWVNRDIHGVFTLAQMDAFQAELEQAAAIHRLR